MQKGWICVCGSDEEANIRVKASVQSQRLNKELQHFSASFFEPGCKERPNKVKLLLEFGDIAFLSALLSWAFPGRTLSSSYSWYWYTEFLSCPPSHAWLVGKLVLAWMKAEQPFIDATEWVCIFSGKTSSRIFLQETETSDDQIPKQFICYFKIKFAFDWLICAVRCLFVCFLHLTDDEKEELWLKSSWVLWSASLIPTVDHSVLHHGAHFCSTLLFLYP